MLQAEDEDKKIHRVLEHIYDATGEVEDLASFDQRRDVC